MRNKLLDPNFLLEKFVFLFLNTSFRNKKVQNLETALTAFRLHIQKPPRFSKIDTKTSVFYTKYY